jgi:hypothetical protein
MPCEEHICVPVAQNCRGSNIRVKGIGVKTFEELAREPDCEHKIDSVVEARLTACCPQHLVGLFCLNLSEERGGLCGSSPIGGMKRV